MKYCDGVFEGGGVKGIALAGAVCGFMRHGYRFVCTAGSSAGAIVAALVAAGLTSRELEHAMRSIHYGKFKGKDCLDYFGLPGRLLSMAVKLGIYNLDYLEEWLGGILAAHGAETFGKLEAKPRPDGADDRPRLQITVTDLTDGRLLVFPDALTELGIDPKTFPVAKAVRMSASIPLFYEPVKLKDADGRVHYLVDGGVLSNYPVRLLDDGSAPTVRPVYGFRFKEDMKLRRKKEKGKLNLPEYIKAVISVMTEAHDMSYPHSEFDSARAVEICSVIKTENGPVKINATDFDLSQDDAELLFQNGQRAAGKFLSARSAI